MAVAVDRVDEFVGADREGFAQALGGIDVLVCCAGGVRGQVGRPLVEINEDDWHVIFEANLESTLWCAQAAAPIMQKAGQGRIVTIASGAGLRPSLTGIQAYTSAKHALVGLTRQLSVELGGFGVTVNAVAPGFVETPILGTIPEKVLTQMRDQVPLQRLGQPQDIANAVKKENRP